MPTVYITTPRDEAESLARTLLNNRAAACVNIVECDSLYWWDDDLEHDPEAILFAKTTEAAYPDLVDLILEHHPYDVPCIERFDEDAIHYPFARWRTDATQHQPTDSTPDHPD